MKVLGIETSCDETGVAVYSATQGLIANVLYSQNVTHSQYGGVVPELASRDHSRKLLPLVRETLQQADLQITDIQGIAYTAGPGLIGPLLVGASFSRSLGFALKIPTVGVHHMESHLLAAMLETPAPTLPFLALLVSGGHTLLVHAVELGVYRILGESIDDAAGEAFDKTAKLLGLPYPGGAALAKLAEQGDAQRFHFPRPMIDRPGLDFSFSGLKTHAMNTWNKFPKDEQIRADIARAFEDAVIDTLRIKCRRAIEAMQLSQLVVAGGVGANRRLREHLQKEMHTLGVKVYFPRAEFCTDNGAMVAFTGYQYLKQQKSTPDLTIAVRARWSLEGLNGS